MDPFTAIADFFLGLIKQGKMEKWYRLGWGCSMAAFISFWATLGIVGSGELFAGRSVAFALASGFFSACLLMASAVTLTIHKQGMWKDLGIALPKQLEQVVEHTDIDKPVTPEERAALLDNLPPPESPSARPS